MDITSFSELYALLQAGDETDRLEAKCAKDALGKSVLETISAFCNTPDMGGGYLMLGVTPPDRSHTGRYEITGIDDIDKIQGSIASVCRQNFSSIIRPVIKLVKLKQGNVLLVYIAEAESHEKPVYILSKGIEKGAFIRIGAADHVCSRYDIDRLYQMRSREHYDQSPVEGASFEDFEPNAIQEYRRRRGEINASARELSYSDDDLLKAVGATRLHHGMLYPTVAGLILFGTEMALRRLFPLCTRVDYIMIEGQEWVGDPKKRYTAIELREALVTAIPRLLNLIMTDIPQAFKLSEDGISRVDNPSLPRDVIREALVNALMHRDYQGNQAVQICRYSNRIEIKNPGHSLLPMDRLGENESKARNNKIATVLHDLQYAETKGTGIIAMRRMMEEANLSTPLLESDRICDTFTISLLTHHFFNQSDIEWLGRLSDANLTPQEARTLIAIREMGALTNSDVRWINGVDTLTASGQLRRLRDLGLLIQKGKAAKTYYLPSEKLLEAPGAGVIRASAGDIRDSAGDIRDSAGDIRDSAGDIRDSLLDTLPTILSEKLSQLQKKASKEEIKKMIHQICQHRPFKLAELASLLERDTQYLRKFYLSEMVKNGELELLYPNSPTHNQQAYLANTRLRARQRQDRA